MMVNILLIIAVIILVVIGELIRRDLAWLESHAKVVSAPEPEPDPVLSFEDDREITGQLLPITEQHCRASGGKGKRKDWKKTPKGKRREDWKSGKEVI